MAIITPIEVAPGARRRLGLASRASLEPIDEIEVAPREDVARALAAARRAQPAWAARPIGEHAGDVEGARHPACEAGRVPRSDRAGIGQAQDRRARIDSGSVCVNDMTMTYGAFNAPFGGRKESGLGSVHGPDGLLGYCHLQAVRIDRFGDRQTAAHYPYSAARTAQMQRIMRLLWGSRLGRFLA